MPAASDGNGAAGRRRRPAARTRTGDRSGHQARDRRAARPRDDRAGPVAAAVPVSPPARTPAPASELPDDRYLNRELSWLDFNARVLALAEDPSQPLLERAKFLAIFASNLDEFYMVRVAGLKRRDETGLAVRSADGLTPREQLARIAARSQELAERHARVFLDDVRPELEADGHPHRALGRARPTTQRPRLSRLLLASRSSRCSPRWRSTRRTRSPTSPGCR